MVARTGTLNVYERVARTENYMSLEVWARPAHQLAGKYYTGGDMVLERPFIEEQGWIAYHANRSTPLDLPDDNALKDAILSIQDRHVSSDLLGATGKVSMFLNRPGMY